MECLESVVSKDKIFQAIPAKSLLMSSQLVHIQGDIYQTLEIGIPFSTLLSFGYMVHSFELSFVDPPWPKLVDYSLTSLLDNEVK